jgi:carbon-monoxide dehydrogenase medium subunit
LSPDFRRPATLDQALDELREEGAVAVGGGTQVALLTKHGLLTPSRLVWLGGVAELRGIAAGAGGELVIGGATSLADIAASPAVRARHAALAEAAAGVGNARVRSVATLGGHLAHADPRQDLPPVLLALDAVAEVRSAHVRREVALAELFIGPFETALVDGELVTAVRLPALPAEARVRYRRFTPGSENDYPTVGVAARLEAENGAIRRAALALAGVDARPLRLDLPQLQGQPVGREAWEVAGEAAAAACDPTSDQRGSAAYKRAMARLWTVRTLAAAIGAADRPDAP